MIKEIETLKVEITKEVIFSNGFSCKYVMNQIGMLDSYIFIKNHLPYHYVPNIDLLQRTLPGSISMQSDLGEEFFPKYTTEEQILATEDFSNYYHIYISANNAIIDKDGNILSTCVTFNNRFLEIWGFGDKSVLEFYEVIKDNTLFSKLHLDDEGNPYSINLLLYDEDFKKLLEKTKRIHDEEAMFYLRDLFESKTKGMRKTLKK